ncbi:uncharacterized protein LOC112569689 isoform X2 [Pomacea canaliculata]|uniref:uncharacterized protein LOC112569689 isoform X2 n=1 Tax=Pomacea canaliculata TaxID=400727 RepID=UPI000D7397F8|nr:uncharacterized protein LOC112569689 isoform X2 [Pomacea canaliculata]
MWRVILWFFVSNFCCPSVNGEGIMCEVITNENGTTEIKIHITKEFEETRESLILSHESTKVRVAVLNRVTTDYVCQTNSDYKCQKLDNYTYSVTSACAPKGEYNISNDEDQPTMCTVKDHTSERQPHDAKTSESNPNTNIEREAGSDEKNELGLGIGIPIVIIIAGLGALIIRVGVDLPPLPVKRTNALIDLVTT